MSIQRALSYVRKPDVCIIGSGIIGNSIALNLGKMGYKVNVYDKNPAPGYGTTSYSSGICRMYYSSLESVKLSWESYKYWNNWKEYLSVIDYNGYAKLDKTGVLFLKSNNSKYFLDKSCYLMKQVGVPFENLNFNDTEQITNKMGLDIFNTYEPVNIDHPNFGINRNKNFIDGSIYFPESGYVGNPQLAALNLYHAAKDFGAHFSFNTRICKINVNKIQNKITGITTTSNEVIDCPIVINCGGPYSTKINNMAFRKNDILNDMKINCRPLRKEVAYTKMDNKYNIKNDGTIVIDLDLGLYYRPETGNKLLIGSTEPKCDKPVWEDNLDLMEMTTTELWTNQMYRAALRIPELKIPNSKNQQFVVSTYDVSDDWTPIYDKSCINGYYMAIGTSGNQFKNTPVVGLMMSQLIDKCENGYDHDKTPFKYKLKKTKGDSINMGAFSRLRKIEQNDGNVFG